MGNSKEVVSLIISMAIFGSTGIFINYIKLPTNIIALARSAIGVVFLLFMLKIQNKKISLIAIRENFWVLAISGIFTGLGWVCMFEAYKYTTVAIATLCCYLSPIILLILSVIIFKEKLKTINIICIFFALLGMIMVSGIMGNNEIGVNTLKGILLGLTSALFYAGVVILNRLLKGISGEGTSIVQIFVVLIIFSIYTLINGFERVEVTPVSVFFLIIIGILNTGIAFSLYYNSIPHLETQTVAIYSYIDPIVAVILSTTILRQKMTLVGVIGAILIIFSTMASELIERKKEKIKERIRKKIEKYNKNIK